jgi:hypothetical protein
MTVPGLHTARNVLARTSPWVLALWGGTFVWALTGNAQLVLLVLLVIMLANVNLMG